MKFRKSISRNTPGINTASMPDVVFLLLIFFMVSTQLRKTDNKLFLITPKTQASKQIEKKNYPVYIYVGYPKPESKLHSGKQPIIQLNNTIATINDIYDFIQLERNRLNNYNKKNLLVIIKADKDVPMGIITDIKQALRKAGALKITYSSDPLINKNQ